MTMTPPDHAASLINAATGNIDRLVGHQLSADQVLATAQVQATSAIAGGLLAIADEMRRTRLANQEAGPTS